MSREVLESKYRIYRMLTAVLTILSLFLGVVLIGQLTMDSPAAPTANANASQAVASTSASKDSPVVRRDPTDPMAIGAIDAPVVLTEWTDMRCPFCAAFHRDTLPTIVQEYVDKGLVRIEVNDVAFFGEQSEEAAVAARAAANQGMFFEYLATVYAAAPSGGHAELPRDALIAFAESTGIPEMAQFTADLDDPAIQAAAKQSTATAQSLGVTAVPFFVAGTTALSGAQPIDTFRQFLDKAIEAAR